MAAAQVRQVEQVWPSLSKLVFVPHSEHDYQQLVSLLDALIDEVGEDERHPLALLREFLGVLIETYEDRQAPEITAP